MAHSKSFLKGLFVLACLGAVGFLLIWKLRCPSRLGVYIQENELPATAQTLILPEDFSILFNGQPACYVPEENTYYLPLNMQEAQWTGWLETAALSQGYRLSFLPDALWGDPSRALAEGHAFTLVIRQGDVYACRSVVFTGLPVLSLTIPGFDFEDQSDNNYFGTLVLQDPGGARRGSSSLQTAFRIHAHGGSTRGFDKKSYKITLLEENGENRGLSLLGMREDDDWILNSLYSDPNRIRDQLSLTLWNAVADTSAADCRGVQSEYAELFINGEYRGIYLLEERLDGKTVQAQPGDVLYKAADWVTPTEEIFADADPATEIRGWSIRYPAQGGSWQPLVELFSLLGREDADWQSACRMLDMDAYVDMMLYRQLICAVDNGPKNMYYYGKSTASGMRWYLLPWDLNLTFGYNLAENAVQSGYYDEQVTLLLDEMGDSLLTESADYRRVLSERWQQLRAGVFSEEALQTRVDELEFQLVQSGAMARDAATWIHGYVSADYTELRSFITRRLVFLDEHYASLAA